MFYIWFVIYDWFNSKGETEYGLLCNVQIKACLLILFIHVVESLHGIYVNISRIIFPVAQNIEHRKTTEQFREIKFI